MDNNNNQDYADLREGFISDFAPNVPPPHDNTHIGKPNFAPKHSNLFMLILVLTNIFLQFMLIIVFAVMMITSPTHTAESLAAAIPSWVQMLGSQVLMLGVPCTIYLIIKRKYIREILPFRRLGWRNVLMVSGLTIAMIPLLGVVNAVSQLVFPNVIAEAMVGVLAEGGLWLSLMIFAIVPPFFEEIAFRGIGFVGFKQVKIGIAAFINGLIFGALHMNMNQFIYAFAGGVIFCYMMYYTKSIWAPILSHFIINAYGAVMTFFLIETDLSYLAATTTQVELNLGGAEVIITVIVMGVITLVFLAAFIAIYIPFKRHNIKRNEAEGIVTDTAAAAREAGLRPPRAFTWAAWVSVVFFVMIMSLIYIIFPLMETML
ncbi:MAG: CPBP family intramembrane metalloprotease [Defluviitaleaceae bacterium]|nr:CPBP family intramembrane metalloprotease [Defluviitaleaceae bacterium]